MTPLELLNELLELLKELRVWLVMGVGMNLIVFAFLVGVGVLR